MIATTFFQHTFFCMTKVLCHRLPHIPLNVLSSTFLENKQALFFAIFLPFVSVIFSSLPCNETFSCSKPLQRCKCFKEGYTSVKLWPRWLGAHWIRSNEHQVECLIFAELWKWHTCLWELYTQSQLAQYRNLSGSYSMLATSPYSPDQAISTCLAKNQAVQSFLWHFVKSLYLCIQVLDKRWEKCISVAGIRN